MATTELEGKGDRVAIAMRNYPEGVLTFWAGVAIGAVVVPLNAWWSGPELVYGLEDSGATVLVADAERLADRLGGRETLGPDRVIGARAGRLPPGAVGFDALAADALDPRVGGAAAGASPEGDLGLPNVDIDPDDDVTILYTSGTTGRPKGVVGTHRNITNFLVAGLYLGAVRAAAAAGGGGRGARTSTPSRPRPSCSSTPTSPTPRWSASPTRRSARRSPRWSAAGRAPTSTPSRCRPTSPGTDLDAGAVQAHVAGRLAAFKVPSVVGVRDDELPRNATGKVLKRQLREEVGSHR